MRSRYTVEQRHITHRGRTFRFVSYEGQRANAARKEPAIASAWFLVNAGYRCEVMPQQLGQEFDEVDRLLTKWLETHVVQ
jgi:hypothetical protein